MVNIFRDPTFENVTPNWFITTEVSNVDGVLTATSSQVDSDFRPPLAGNSSNLGDYPVFDNDQFIAGATYKLSVELMSSDPVHIKAGVAHDWQIDEVVTPSSTEMTLVELVFDVPEAYAYSSSLENGAALNITNTVSGQNITIANPVLEEHVETVVTIDDPSPLAFNIGEEVGVELSGSTTHTDPTLTWSVDQLPPGLTLEGNLISGTLTEDGTFVTIITAMDGNGSVGTLQVTWTVGAIIPDEPGSLEELDNAAMALAPRLLKLLRETEDTENLAAAQAAIAQVISFVHAYTRGWGFGPRLTARPVGVDSESVEAIAYSPIATPLKQVIINASVRLYTNPEQVYNYTANDYSERPAALTGFLLVEQATLNRYRRRTA